MPNAALSHAPEPVTSNICNNLLKPVCIQEITLPAYDAASITAHGSSPAQGGLAPWQCKAILDHIDTTFTGPVRIEDLAGLARLSTSHFSRAFKISFGETPYAFVIGKRLHRAKMLMLSTDEPLSRIALDCGLSDQAHLSNLFRKFMGMAPNAWRRLRKTAEAQIFAVGEACG